MYLFKAASSDGMTVDLAWREVLMRQEMNGMKSVQEGVLTLHKQHLLGKNHIGDGTDAKLLTV